MKHKICRLTLFLLLFSLSNAEARIVPSGMSGVINTPTAHMRPFGHFDVSFQYSDSYRNLSTNAVVLPGVEVAYSHWFSSGKANYNLYSMKYNFLPETVVTPAVTVGVEDVTDEIRRSGFVAVSKAGPWGLMLHGGVGTGRFREGFVALEKQFKVNSDNLNLGLALEYDGNDFNYGMFVPVGALLQAEAGIRSNKFYAGLHGSF